MENYKIRVNSEAESKEAQELFFELGFKWVNEDEGVYWETPTCFIFAKSRTKTLFSFSSDQDVVLVELTIPQLKDLVVLKRNDKSDATHKSKSGFKWFVASDNKIHSYSNKQWVFISDDPSDLQDLKPIEKTMKEYINKTTGEYLKTADVVTGEQWIEVPEGAAILSEFDGGEKENYFAFYKQGKDRLMCCYPKELEWCSTGWLNLEGFLFERKDSMRVVWQRPQQPEYPKGTELVIQDKGGNIRYFRNGCGYEFFSDACWHGVSIPFAVLEESKILWLKEGCHAFWDVGRTRTLPSPFNFVADSKQPEELPFADDEPTLKDIAKMAEGKSYRMPSGLNRDERREWAKINDQYAEIEQVRQKSKLDQCISNFKNMDHGKDFDEFDLMSDNVNHPNHYTQGGIECIDALESATIGKRGIEAVCTANIIKYLWRYEEKNGLEDVKKAQWYLNRLIKQLEK